MANSTLVSDDLQIFDSQFGLPSCTVANGCVEKMEPQGAPLTDSGWALEISLDVEWAHAIAPGAKIVLVESSDNSLGNLLSAVDTAVGTSAQQVSNSWGGGEFSGENTYDYHFDSTTASFTASSGDGGHGVEWPAASPYVISVGGTNLVNGSSGNWVSETAWSGSGGGFSTIESRPSYQNNFNSNSNRAVPDVAYDGDPNTGFYVYDSVPILVTSCNCYEYGWWVVGGTSAGAPQWAALLAIVNSGNTKLASASFGTSNALYGAAAGAPSNPPYTTNYHDITSGSNGCSQSVCNAGPGYDEVTGLGSPQANNLIPYLTPTCGISFPSGTSINYGTITPGATSAEQTLTLHNTGNVAATLTVHGANWLDGSSTSQMLVGNTKFSTSSGSYGSKTALSSSSDQTVGTLLTTSNLSTFWQLAANLIHPSFHGSVTQTVTFTASC
jgi:subtilase family serine protease